MIASLVSDFVLFVHMSCQLKPVTIRIGPRSYEIAPRELPGPGIWASRVRRFVQRGLQATTTTINTSTHVRTHIMLHELHAPRLGSQASTAPQYRLPCLLLRLLALQWRPPHSRTRLTGRDRPGPDSTSICKQTPCEVGGLPTTRAGPSWRHRSPKSEKCNVPAA